MRRLTALILAFVLIPSLGAADSMYKWVDAQGHVHYSDKPAPGATKIEVPRAKTFTPPQVAAATYGSENGNQQSPAATGYTAISISSPQDQETLWNVPSVTVSVSLSPALNPGDTVIITLDGSSQTVNGTSATFNGLDRGPHTVTASVSSSQGGGMTAHPITFYIQKASQSKPP